MLPILDTRHADEAVVYASKMFVTLERDVLSEDRVAGTNILVADHYSEAEHADGGPEGGDGEDT